VISRRSTTTGSNQGSARAAWVWSSPAARQGTIYDIRSEGDVDFIVMEYIEGGERKGHA
jgi:hypothetical protein